MVLLRSSQGTPQRRKQNIIIMGMRNHTYTLEVERQTGGGLKITSAKQLVRKNQHASSYERVNKAAFEVSANWPKAARRTTSVAKPSRKPKSRR